MTDYNLRAEEMWLQINKAMWFSNMTVVDFGCGGGDFLWRAIQAGATNVIGVDKDVSIAQKYIKIYRRTTGEGREVLATCDVREVDLDRIRGEDTELWRGDIAMCFSVVPYLKEPIKFLRWMAENYSVCLLEMQYKGDGPGLDDMRDAKDCEFLLKNAVGFVDTDIIGYTYVKENSFKRDIWRCMI